MDNITKGQVPPALLRTPMHDLHVAAGAQMVPFVGWEMPLLYKGIIPEHQHTRTACSIFDVSHMGRIVLTGPQAAELLEQLCTRKVGDLPVGRVRYGYMCNEEGGILDDLVVARYEDRWLVVCNGSNRDKILAWVLQHAKGRQVHAEDITAQTAMVAVQGPRTVEILQPMLPFDISGLKNWAFTSGSYMGMDYYISRSGYTGEDGIEAIVPAAVGAFLWQRLVQAGEGQPEGVQIRPAGLGARDTLRLEAGLPLYGHELTEQTNPIAAGFGWAVNLDKEFVGAVALRRVAERGPARKLAGLELAGRRIARQDAQVQDGSDHVIGTVTSGTLGPTVGKSVAMAYVDRQHAEPGRRVVVKLREQAIPATVVALPFYKRAKKS